MKNANSKRIRPRFDQFILNDQDLNPQVQELYKDMLETCTWSFAGILKDLNPEERTIVSIGALAQVLMTFRVSATSFDNTGSFEVGLAQAFESLYAKLQNKAVQAGQLKNYPFVHAEEIMDIEKDRVFFEVADDPDTDPSTVDAEVSLEFSMASQAMDDLATAFDNISNLLLTGKRHE